MSRRPESAQPTAETRLPRLFEALFGAFLGLSLLKFGNPPIMERWVTPPTNAYEFVLDSPWPILWAYILLAALLGIGFFVAKWPVRVPRWLILLPAAWLAWTFIASFWTENSVLSKPTLAHYSACVVCFYLGLFCLAPVRRLTVFWLGLIFGLFIVLAIGWEQHFGGLEQTKRYFFLYIYPNLKEVPPEYIKKLSSSRIFSTLFYPNALAGALLLVLPPVLQALWQSRKRFTLGARVLLIALFSIAGLGCLYWSGSKGGWLLMLLLGLLWVLRLPFSRVLKRNIIMALLVIGLTAFFLKYVGFFQKGATSVSARFDYWQAAIHTAITRPLTGTGPGTFSIAYQRVKRPESEMSRLVHNDYLEQASDSGIPGFLLYTVFVASALVFSYPRLNPSLPKTNPTPTAPPPVSPTPPPIPPNPLRFAIWLGVLGWALQGTMEFGLFIPSLAWPALALIGTLLGLRSAEPAEPDTGSKRIDKQLHPR
jgi:O-antigen ligase